MQSIISFHYLWLSNCNFSSYETIFVVFGKFMITIITPAAPLSHSWATERYAKIMKPFCLGYISQVMWRLFVTFPRNGAGTCIPHPGPSQQTAQATPSSSLISPAPPNGDPAFAAKVARAKFCCPKPTGDHNLGNSYCLWLALWNFIFHAILRVAGSSLLWPFWLSGHYLFASVSSPRSESPVCATWGWLTGWSCNLVPV